MMCWGMAMARKCYIIPSPDRSRWNFRFSPSMAAPTADKIRALLKHPSK